MLTREQINNLITGREMAAELSASGEGLRRFIQVRGLEPGENGRFRSASKFVKRSKYETVYFWVRVFELPAEYVEKQWDVAEDEMTSYHDLGKVQGIAALENVLKDYLQGHSLLVTSDKTDCPL